MKKFCAYMVHLESGEDKIVSETTKDALIVTVGVWRGMGWAVNRFYEE
jgi:hypothetical protein